MLLFILILMLCFEGQAMQSSSHLLMHHAIERCKFRVHQYKEHLEYANQCCKSLLERESAVELLMSETGRAHRWNLVQVHIRKNFVKEEDEAILKAQKDDLNYLSSLGTSESLTPASTAIRVIDKRSFKRSLIICRLDRQFIGKLSDECLKLWD